jgi:nicotinamidase-related amidase
VKDALLLVDIVNDFRHDDGEALLESFRARHAGLVQALTEARGAGVPVVYANDNHGVWDGDAPRLVRHAIEEGRGGELVAEIAPLERERFVVKPRYSAFDHTPLLLILRELEIERLLLAGTTTEACVAQTAIDGRELGFKISVLADACATVDERIERIALDYLANVVGVRIERLSQTTGRND